MFQKLLDGALRRLVVKGRLTVHHADGTITVHEGEPGPEAGFRIHGAAAERRLVANPALAFGELYMEGATEPLGCDIGALVELLVMNQWLAPPHPIEHALAAFRQLRRRIAQLNPAPRAKRDVVRSARDNVVRSAGDNVVRSAGDNVVRSARDHVVRSARDNVVRSAGDNVVRSARDHVVRSARDNVAHHYDLNGRLYSLFLDRDRQYSCAYFPTGRESLEEAQALKKRHTAAKLRLDRPGLEVLDIGCGWGGMALHLARDWGCRVTGITLSEEQLAEARRRAAEAGLSDRVRFELMDYRDWTRPVDRVVSVGMFEHVGIVNYATFFRRVREALKPDGVALVHAIGRMSGPGSTNPWLAKYIFPGGYSPALSEVVPAVEKAGLWITDVEILRLHYALTIAEWRRRFAANRDAIVALYDERFCRMFEFYLAGCEATFRHGDHMNWQVQLTRERMALPLTRGWMHDVEEAAPRPVQLAAE